MEIVEHSRLADGRYLVDVVGKRPFNLTAPPVLHEQGYWVGRARVGAEPSGDGDGDDADEAASLLGALPGLVGQWKTHLVEHGYERRPGQLNAILDNIGAMPERDARAAALWVGALINPLPGLGVAPEVSLFAVGSHLARPPLTPSQIRPTLLAARSSLTMLQIAHYGLSASLQHLSTPPLRARIRAFLVRLLSLSGARLGLGGLFEREASEPAAGDADDAAQQASVYARGMSFRAAHEAVLRMAAQEELDGAEEADAQAAPEQDEEEVAR